MHFLKEIPVHEMQKLRKGRRKGRRVKKQRRKERRVKEEWKKERRKEKRDKEKDGEKKKVEYGRCLLVFLVIQLNGEGQREEEPWNLGAGVSEAQVQAILKTLL